MLRFLYITDLHGDARAYRRLPDLCREHDTKIIVNGGDMLPKGRNMHAEQKKFLRKGLPAFLDRCADAGITFYGLFGNDDLRALHNDWLEMTLQRSGVHDLEVHWHELPDGLFIRGCSFVPDYPFGLKDWCLRDLPNAHPVPTSRAVTSTADGFATIDSPAQFFASRPTLRQHLESLLEPGIEIEDVIFVSHAPPHGLSLATLENGQDVGSKSVRDFIEDHEPLLVLSGHIHESPDVEERRRGEPWHTTHCGGTTCHQPGQALPRRLTYTIVEIFEDGLRIAWTQAQWD